MADGADDANDAGGADGPGPAGLEAICRRCGRCCHEKVRFGEQVIITDIPCPYFDVETKRCAIYAERLSGQPRCSTAENSVRTGTLPDDCPYVGGRTDHQTALMISDHPEYGRAIDALFPDRRRGGKCGKST